jgi:hypothetical protein
MNEEQNWSVMTEEELAFEKELSRLRKLRDNAGKSIKDHKEKVAMHKAIMETETKSMLFAKYAEERLAREIRELYEKREGI